MSNIFIQAHNMTKIYDPDVFLKRGKNFYALNNVNFILEEGDFTCIMGPSGSGKSTLLNCLSTLDKVTSGHITFMGQDISTLNKDTLCDFRYQYLGFVFQNHNLISYLSIFDNIASPLLLASVKADVVKQRVLELAKDLEIEDLLDKFPNECSGGECQRVAIARALVNHPKILFCDEPTGNLDSKNSHRVLKILSELNKKGTSIILVTHDAMIASYAKNFMYLYDGGIQTVIHRNNVSQLDFFKKINEITTQDSLLKEFSNEEVTKEQIEPIKEDIEIVSESTKREFISRHNVYFILNNHPYEEHIAKNCTPLYINETKVHYRNQYNDDIKFDLSTIKDLTIDLKAKFVNFGLASQYVFNVLMDFNTQEGSYKFKLINKDDVIQFIDYFKNHNIPINDPRNIQEAYHKYPRDYERQKFFIRTHKDLTKYDSHNIENPMRDQLLHKAK